jgi:hypothetical protein
MVYHVNNYCLIILCKKPFHSRTQSPCFESGFFYFESGFSKVKSEFSQRRVRIFFESGTWFFSNPSLVFEVCPFIWSIFNWNGCFFPTGHHTKDAIVRECEKMWWYQLVSVLKRQAQYNQSAFWFQFKIVAWMTPAFFQTELTLSL